MPVTVLPEPAMTSPGRRAGYGSLGAVKAYGTGAYARRNWSPLTAAAHHPYIHVPCIHYGGMCNGPI